LNGLATGARDMVGLDKSRTFFSSQVFHSLGTQKKITICLFSTSGVVQLGKVVHESQLGSEIFRSLTLTVSAITPYVQLGKMTHESQLLELFNLGKWRMNPSCGIMCIRLFK